MTTIDTASGGHEMAKELKPCPFCGDVPGEGRHVSSQGGKWGSVVCSCLVVGPEVRTNYKGPEHWGAAADEAWNTRAKQELTGQQWRQIDTAPRDGTRVLLAIDHGEGCDKVWTGLWADGWIVSYGKPIASVTHWMDLPDAPQEKAND